MRKNKYYNVPITSEKIKSKFGSLYSMLKVVDEELYNRELGRKIITYSGYSNKSEIDKYNNETSQMFELRCLPERLILISDEYGIRELQTEFVIDCFSTSYLDAFKIDGDDVVDFFVLDEKYADKVDGFFKVFLDNRRNVLSKTAKKN